MNIRVAQHPARAPGVIAAVLAVAACAMPDPPVARTIDDPLVGSAIFASVPKNVESSPALVNHPSSGGCPRAAAVFPSGVEREKDPRGVRLELHPVGEATEVRLILRGRDSVWWCGGDELSAYLRLEAVDADGNVVADSSTCGDTASDDEVGHSWMMSLGDTIALGRLEISCATNGSGFRVAGPEPLCLDVPAGARLRATWDVSLDASQLDRCRRRAEARWYAASPYRQQVPWRPPDGPLHRRFPVDAEDLRMIESLPRLSSNELALVPLTWEAKR